MENGHDIHQAYVYGAGKWGIRVLAQLKDKGIEVANILVTDKGDNPDVVGGVRVVEIEEMSDFHSDAAVIIAVAGGEERDTA